MDSPVSSSSPPRLLPEGISFTLRDKHLWEEIEQKDTNQVLVLRLSATHNGRRLYPGMQFKVNGLDPKKQYSVFIRFQEPTGAIWQCSAYQCRQTTSFKEKPYVTDMLEHEDGPQTGEKWSSRGIDFSKIVFCASEHPRKICVPTRCQFEPILSLFEVNTRKNEKLLLKEEGFPLCRFTTTSTETKSFNKLKGQMKKCNVLGSTRPLKRLSSLSKGSRSSTSISNGPSIQRFLQHSTALLWQGPSLSFPATSVPLLPTSRTSQNSSLSQFPIPYPSLASFSAPYTSMTTAQTPIYTTHPLPCQSFSLNPLALPTVVTPTYPLNPYVSLLNLIAPSQASQAAESLPLVLEKENEEQDQNSVPVNFKSVDSLI